MASAGDRYGPYSCVRKLGEGGMAETYLAHQVGPRGFEQRVCIKIIRPDCRAQPKFTEMFIAEAGIAASLRHSNIVSVIDVSQEGGYMVLELVDGVDLRTLAQATPGRRLVSDLVTYVALELVKALDFAHNRRLRGKPDGLVHRDIKPSNVLVSYSGEVKIADFGIAKAISSAGDSDGLIRGTPHYMSPEQAQGLPLDARSDLFSLGIMLYELLAGRRPFDGEDDLDTCRRICVGDYLPLAETAPDVPAGLAAVVDRLLRIEPERRYHSAEALGRALDKFAPAPSVYRRLAVLAREARPPETLVPLDATGGPVVSLPVVASADSPEHDARASPDAEHEHPTAHPGEPQDPAAAARAAGAEQDAVGQPTLPIADTEPMFGSGVVPPPDASTDADMASPLPPSAEPSAEASPQSDEPTEGPASWRDPATADKTMPAFLRGWLLSAKPLHLAAAVLVGLAVIAATIVLVLRPASTSSQGDGLTSAGHQSVNGPAASTGTATAFVANVADVARTDAAVNTSPNAPGVERGDISESGLAATAAAPTAEEPSSAARSGAMRTSHAPLRGAVAKGAARIRVGVFPWGKVWIDGEACGGAPVYAELPAGKHIVGGGLDRPIKSKVVRLKPAENRQIVVSLKADADGE